MRLEAVGLAVDPCGGVAIGSVDEAEDLAGLLVDPVVLVIDAIRVLDLDVGLMGSDDIAGFDARQIVDIRSLDCGALPSPLGLDDG